MNRTYETFPVSNVHLVKQQILSWCSQFDICCFFDNHNYPSRYHSFECLAGVGTEKIFKPSDNFSSSLKLFEQQTSDWIFGHLNYDCKNILFNTSSSFRIDNKGFPDYFLFVPNVVLQLTDATLTLGVLEGSITEIYRKIIEQQPDENKVLAVRLKPQISKDEYCEKVQKVLGHLKRGDCYELNFCQEFFANDSLNPLNAYRSLSQISPTPFAAFYRIHHNYLLCASPERYVKKIGSEIISQPIKGTIVRGTDIEKDRINKEVLLSNEKERSENVMVVDLVRNDLSKVAAEGTVKVEELFGIYSFPQVHQMISTITGKLQRDVSFCDVLEASFPMASMTGAPKEKVMQLIEQLESTKRGIYSGTVGYISPNGDFDFNVVIRSIVYNDKTNHISYHVGSAITINSEPVKEYEECLLKAKAINQALSGVTDNKSDSYFSVL